MGRHDESIDVLNEIINSNSSEQRAKVTALINKGLLYCIKMDRKDDASLIFKEAVKEKCVSFFSNNVINRIIPNHSRMFSDN